MHVLAHSLVVYFIVYIYCFFVLKILHWRFNSAVRQSHVPGANMASAAAKADAVREEYEEAANKVENIKVSKI